MTIINSKNQKAQTKPKPQNLDKRENIGLTFKNINKLFGGRQLAFNGFENRRSLMENQPFEKVRPSTLALCPLDVAYVPKVSDCMCLIISTLKQMLQKLPRALAWARARNTSKKSLKETLQIIFFVQIKRNYQGI